MNASGNAGVWKEYTLEEMCIMAEGIVIFYIVFIGVF